MTEVKIFKEELPKPCDVRTSVNELKHWREVRYSKDLPTGALDNAITYLNAFNTLLNHIYLTDLDQAMEDYHGQKVEAAQTPGPDA